MAGKFAGKNVRSGVNGLKEKYGLLDHKIDNKLLPKIGSYFRNSPFLNNTFGRRLLSDVKVLDEVVQRMHTHKSVTSRDSTT